MNREEILTQVIEMVAEVAELEVEEVSADANLPDELGIDSLMGLEILVMVERSFGAKLQEEQLQLMTTPDKITELIIENLSVAA